MKIKNKIPDILTWCRVAAIVVVVMCYLSAPFWNTWHVTAGLLLILASITDWLDGYLARKWQVTSSFGAFLDPVADKVLVATTLLILVDHYHHWSMLIPAWLILMREVSMSALREWAVRQNMGDAIAVSWFGKVKTVIQLIAICSIVILLPALGSATYKALAVFFWIAAYFTCHSFVEYVRGMGRS